nr:hypothetical protein [Tanacetum cinerariifolium]
MPCRHCFPRFVQRFARSSVPVLDHRILVEILHRSLFILGLNALISKSHVHLRRRQLPWTRRIGSLSWRRSLMSWVVRMHSRLDWWCTSLRVMHLLSGKPISKPKECLKREYHSIRQTNTETSTEFMQRFLRLAGFLGAAAGTAEEQAKNFHDNHRSNNNYSGNNNRSFGNGRDQRNRGQQSNRPVNSGFQQSRGPSEGYSYSVCTTCGRRHPGEGRRATGTCFKCGQTGHLQKDCKKNTAA